MTFKCGNGYITIDGGRMTAHAETALHCKAKATVAKTARPTRCPYCKSTDIDDQRGWAECRDCGKTWSW